MPHFRPILPIAHLIVIDGTWCQCVRLHRIDPGNLGVPGKFQQSALTRVDYWVCHGFIDRQPQLSYTSSRKRMTDPGDRTAAL